MALFFLPKAAPVSGGENYAQCRLYFYATGTSTAATVYTDSALTTAHPQPVVADAGGVFAPIYVDSTVEYRVVLRSSGGSLIWDVDPFTAAFASATDIGDLLWPISTAETAAGLVAANLNTAYREGDVRRYGALGDGVTNDTTAVQYAVSVSAAGGPAAYLPAGTYKITAAISVTGNASLYGDGRESVLAPVSCRALQFSAQTDYGGQRFFRDFAIVGTTTSAVSAIYADIDGVTDRVFGINFSNLYIEGFQNAGRLRGFWGCTFSDLFCYNNYCGFHLYGRNIKTSFRNCAFVKGAITGTGERKGIFNEIDGSGYRSEDIQVERCWIFQYDVGVDLVNVLYSTVIACDIDYAADVGVRLTTVDGGCIVRDNWIATGDDTDPTYGIQLLGRSVAQYANIVIDGNHLLATEVVADSTGIVVNVNQNCVTITNNRVQDFDIGIKTVAADYAVVQYNSVDAGTTAIYIDSLSEDNTVGPNYIEAGTALVFSAALPVRFRYNHVGSFTATVTGLNATVTGTVRYVAHNGVVTLTHPAITGTSNTTACTVTGLPSVLSPNAAQVNTAHVTDGGTGFWGMGSMGTDGVLTLSKGPNSDVFTGSGTKGLASGTFTYTLT